MAEFAQFVALEDDWFRPSANPKHLTFDLPGLNPSRTVVIMFKIMTSGKIRLQMRLNGLVGFSVDNKFEPAPGSKTPRSWHEIVPGDVFKALDNDLSISVSELGSSDDYLSLSDFVFLYHVNTDQADA